MLKQKSQMTNSAAPDWWDSPSRNAPRNAPRIEAILRTNNRARVSRALLEDGISRLGNTKGTSRASAGVQQELCNRRLKRC